MDVDREYTAYRQIWDFLKELILTLDFQESLSQNDSWLWERGRCGHNHGLVTDR